MKSQMNVLNGLCPVPSTENYNCAYAKEFTQIWACGTFPVPSCGKMNLFSPNNILNLARCIREKGCFSNLGMGIHESSNLFEPVIAANND